MLHNLVDDLLTHPVYTCPAEFAGITPLGPLQLARALFGEKEGSLCMVPKITMHAPSETNLGEKANERL